MIHQKKSFAKGSLKVFGMLVLSFLITSASHPQVRLAGMAGVSYVNNGALKFTGALNAGYEFKGFSILYDQRHQVFTGPSWFGGNAGYIFQLGPLSIRPYAGYWYKTTGNKSSKDRYMQDGTEQVLSTNNEINSKTAGYGMQFFSGKYMIDMGYHGVYSLTIGMGGLLRSR
jgi:hypothetical protein